MAFSEQGVYHPYDHMQLIMKQTVTYDEARVCWKDTEILKPNY